MIGLWNDTQIVIPENCLVAFLRRWPWDRTRFWLTSFHGVPLNAIWEVLVIPGSFLLFLVLWLFGENHSNYRWDWMIPPFNGAGYMGIIAVLMWVVNRLKRLLVRSN